MSNINLFSLLRNLPRALDEQMTIDDIPLELLEVIFQWAEIPPNPPKISASCLYEYRGNSNDVGPNEEHLLFKTLRLVCSKWHDVATPMLFREVILLSHKESWEYLNNIASTPWVAPHVRTIQFATIPNLPVYENFDDYLMGNSTYRDAQARTSGPDGAPSSLIRRNAMSSYPRYQVWIAAEQEMQKHWERGSTPPLKLHLLTALNRVETVGHDALAVVKRVYNRSSGIYWLSPRRSHDNGTRREFITHCHDSVTHERDICPHHLDLFLRAAQSSSLKWDTLALRNSQELLQSTRTIYVQGLRRLELNLETHDWIVPYRRRDEYPLSSWVHTLHNLQELSIATMHDYPVFKLLSDVSWPSLRVVDLRLGGPVKTDLGCLLNFVEHQCQTLQLLRIEGSRASTTGGSRAGEASEESSMSTCQFVHGLRNVVGSSFQRLEVRGLGDWGELRMLRGWVVKGDVLEPYLR